MRRHSMLAAILVSLAVLTAASSASAMYHPTVGRWAARDPSGYGDGHNLLEYGRSSPNGKPDPYGLSPGWFAHFDELGCCDCNPDAVVNEIQEFLNTAAALLTKASEGPLDIFEAGDFVNDGIVANAAGLRTDLYYAMPECVSKVVDNVEKNKMLIAASAASWFFGVALNVIRTGSLQVVNAWLRMEAQRDMIVAGQISNRLIECEQLKIDHPDWAACCYKD